jgi:hypothetical protein
MKVTTLCYTINGINIEQVYFPLMHGDLQQYKNNHFYTVKEIDNTPPPQISEEELDRLAYEHFPENTVSHQLFRDTWKNRYRNNKM